MMRYMLITVIALACLAAFLGILQLWTSILPWDIFVKIMITLGVLALLCGILVAVKSDLGAHKKMKDENYLD